MGSESITIAINDNEKQMITAMATVSAAGTKLPLFLIAKGKTSRAEQNQLGPISHHMSFHSENGWMCQEAFNSYLKFLRQQYNDSDPLF